MHQNYPFAEAMNFSVTNQLFFTFCLNTKSDKKIKAPSTCLKMPMGHPACAEVSFTLTG